MWASFNEIVQQRKFVPPCASDSSRMIEASKLATGEDARSTFAVAHEVSSHFNAGADAEIVRVTSGLPRIKPDTTVAVRMLMIWPHKDVRRQHFRPLTDSKLLRKSECDHEITRSIHIRIIWYTSSRMLATSHAQNKTCFCDFFMAKTTACMWHTRYQVRFFNLFFSM